jgi:hypothetical protein
MKETRMEWRDISPIHSDQAESDACYILTAKAQRRGGAEKRKEKG